MLAAGLTESQVIAEERERERHRDTLEISRDPTHGEGEGECAPWLDSLSRS